eukprot:TRINITY_DN589_c0_g1_i1.p1 TRINITY_DN589_c0_g1~~TRINITY_DN589_c0_g1_i1.p1  ORF type:complete len:548 (-),score=118.52 TRINITY_DN589_c0_g1_i1:98-1741(-)
MSSEYTHLKDGSEGSFFQRNKTVIFIVVGAIVLLLIAAVVIALIVGLAVGLHKDDDDEYIDLSSRIQVSNIMNHLQNLQNIAGEHNQTRAAVTAGYNASVEYVYQKLRSAGYNPVLHTFQITSTVMTATPALIMNTPKTITYRYGSDFYVASGASSGQVNQAKIYQVPNFGCLEEDYVNFPNGYVAVISRSPPDDILNSSLDACTILQKANLSLTRGAVGVIVYNDGLLPSRLPAFQAGLGGVISIPVFTTSFLVGDHIACYNAEVSMSLATTTYTVDTNNIIAETSDGDKNNVVVIGAHLDSVPAGPGINDDGSGSATVLEIALQVAENGWQHFAAPNALRFCWWSGEELGLLGSTAYVRALQRNDSYETIGDITQIAAYLNFDMIGSPNFVRGVLNGSSSQNAIEGCTRIQHMFEDDLEKSIGANTYEPAAFGPPYRSDYGPFVTAGIPGGGLFTGAEVIKTEEQRSRYGGLAGVAFDPCYHLACDTVDNIDKGVLEQFSKTAARVMQRLSTMGDIREHLNSNATTTEDTDWAHFSAKQTRMNVY